MTYCEDCGCKVYNGICTNCYEELYIEEQCYEFNIPISDKFNDKLNELKQKLKNDVKNIK